MVERTDPFESKEIGSFKLKLLNNTQSRIILKLIPNFGENFPHYNLGYLSKILGLNQAYLTEILDFLCDRDIVSFEGENFYLSQDNLYRIENVLNIQPMVLLKRKIEELNK